ncbi:MAG TPA: ankyrin repeat domain-containing protein [Herbaspirillum sp.]|jgi:ankyrin repeat protein
MPAIPVNPVVAPIVVQTAADSSGGARVRSDSAATGTTIDTLEKIKTFIDASIPKGKEGEFKSYILEEKILDDLEGEGKNAWGLAHAMAAAHFLDVDAKSGSIESAKNAEAIQKGIKNIIEAKMASDPDFNINASVGPDAKTFLILAAHFNLTDVALFLIEKGVNPLEKDIFRQTAAMKAAATGSSEAFNVLLQWAIKETLREERNNPRIRFAETTLGKSLSGKSQQLWTVLHYAANKGSAEILKSIFKLAGEEGMIAPAMLLDLLGAGEQSGRTPLGVAAAKGKDGAVKAIMDFVKEHAPQRKNEFMQATDNYDNRAIDDAVRFGHLEAVKALCLYGPDLRRPNGIGETPLAAVDRLHIEERRIHGLIAESKKTSRSTAVGQEFDPEVRNFLVSAGINKHLDRNIRNKMQRQATAEAMARKTFGKMHDFLKGEAPASTRGVATAAAN